MANIKEVLIVLIYIATNFKGLLSYHCTEANVQRCMNPTEAYMRKMKQLNPQHEELALFHLNEQQIREYCRIYDKQTSNCLAGLIGHCTYADKKAFQGIEDSSDFLCKESLEEYIRHKSCIGSDKVQNKLVDCVRQMDFKISQLDMTLPYSQLSPKICSIIYDAVDCDVKAASVCGSEAQEWVKTYELKFVDPLMEEYDCDNGDTSELITRIVPIVVAFVVVMIIIGIAVACYCQHKKRTTSARQQNSDPVAFSNVLSGGLAVSNAPPAFGSTDEKSGLPPDYRYSSQQHATVEPPPSYRSNDGMSNYEGASVHNQPSPVNPPQYTTLQSNITASQPVYSDRSVAGSNIQDSNPVYVDPENKHSINTPDSAGNRESTADYSYAYAQPR